MTRRSAYDEFVDYHAALVEVRKKIAEHEYALSLLRQKERELEGQSTYYFRCMMDRPGDGEQQDEKR